MSYQTEEGHGRLYVLEGPDGVGKSTISKALVQHLAAADVAAQHVALPGRKYRTLGKLVYDIHHGAIPIHKFHPASLQLLHIASHIDAIESIIRPHIANGISVILDRYWWSTFVYGLVSGVKESSLDAMIEVELGHWGSLTPDAVILIDRYEPFERPADSSLWQEVRREYKKLAIQRSHPFPVYVLRNESAIENAITTIVNSVILHSTGVGDATVCEGAAAIYAIEPCVSRLAEQLTLWGHDREEPTSKPPLIFSKLAPAKTTEVYDTYWRFACERQNIFFHRLTGLPPPYTHDRILQKYKFTNAYRASDRVSQYLIKKVIYDGSQLPMEVFFRIILFKIFNRIDTWEWLLDRLGSIKYDEFSFDRCNRVLGQAMKDGRAIYSAAYIMASGKSAFGQDRKHENHLRLVELMMNDRVPESIAEAASLREVFELLRSYPSLGDFLAYQYSIDLNYSNLTNFSEMEFILPGPGARDGIRKCFSDLGGLSEADAIRLVTERQEAEVERLGLDFKTLWGRPLQFIDCQNLFCEVDKYARVAHPKACGISGRTKIKQKFSASRDPLRVWYPPKWGINEQVEQFYRSV